MDASAQRSAVTKCDVEWARLTVFPATKAIAVAGEPLVEPIGEPAYKRGFEDPRDEAAFWKDLEQLLDSRRSLPGATTRADELQRLGVGSRRNPRESRHY